MIEEFKVEKAVEFGLSKIHPSSDLLDRINDQAEHLHLRSAPVRLSLWSRLRLGPKLEFVAACILLVSLVGVAAYRNFNSSQAPSKNEPGSGKHEVAPNSELAHYVPKANDVTLARMTGLLLPAYQPLQPQNPADLSIITKVLGWLEDGQVLSRLSQEDVAKGNDFDLPRNRSNSFRFELRNGGFASIRQAYGCTPLEIGSGTACHSLDGEVIFIPSGGEAPIRLKQSELAKWLSDGWQQDMKLLQSQGNVPPTTDGDTDSAAVALRFVDAMLKRDKATMRMLVVPDQAKLVESPALDLRSGHGAGPTVAEPPKVDPATAIQDGTSARYDVLVGLFYGNDIYRYRLQIRLQTTDAKAWLASDVQVNLIR